jgi:hypothetical protein
MATDLISFPFRLAPNGSVVTRPDNSNEYYAEEIGQIILTKSGERVQVPAFGLDDPTFHRIDPQELALKVGMFRIPVRIVSVTTKQISNKEQDAMVMFEPLESGAPTVRTVTTNIVGG